MLVNQVQNVKSITQIQSNTNHQKNISNQLSADEFVSSGRATKNINFKGFLDSIMNAGKKEITDEKVLATAKIIAENLCKNQSENLLKPPMISFLKINKYLSDLKKLLSETDKDLTNVDKLIELVQKEIIDNNQLPINLIRTDKPQSSMIYNNKHITDASIPSSQSFQLAGDAKQTAVNMAHFLPDTLIRFANRFASRTSYEVLRLFDKSATNPKFGDGLDNLLNIKNLWLLKDHSKGLILENIYTFKELNLNYLSSLFNVGSETKHRYSFYEKKLQEFFKQNNITKDLEEQEILSNIIELTKTIKFADPADKIRMDLLRGIEPAAYPEGLATAYDLKSLFHEDLVGFLKSKIETSKGFKSWNDTITRYYQKVLDSNMQIDEEMKQFVSKNSIDLGQTETATKDAIQNNKEYQQERQNFITSAVKELEEFLA